AILKCGGYYVPLDHSAPDARLGFMLEDCAARLVLTRAGQRVVEVAGLTRLELDRLEVQAASPEDLGLALDCETPAYVMYPSGSTGRPKGVIVPHRAIGRVVVNNRYAAFDVSDRVAFAANPAFDASTLEVWGALLNGGCSVIIAADELLDPARLARALRQQQVTAMWLTASLFNQLAVAIPDTLAELRYLLSGGERNDPAAFASVLRHGGPRHLIQGYGPTETTTFATTCEITAVADGTKNLPIGRPIADTTVYVLDRRGQLVPRGVAGEIYIGGAGVARGYLNRPELTEERFVRDPFAGEPGARMYRTGDLARWLPDGALEFLGRNDDQVKIRGFRIELGEIEAQLARQPGVRAAVVVVREDSPGDRRLVAYLVGAAGEPAPEAAALRPALLRELPDYMVPAAYVVLPALPLTANGKLDRKALPAPEGDAFAQQAYEAPHGEVEEALAEIWCELLNLERVGRRDNFFELGGHSMLSTRLVAGARRRGLIMDLQQVFDAATLADLAAVVKPDLHGVVTRTTLVPVRASGTRRPLFCLHDGFGSVLAYERLARCLDPDVPIYSVEAEALHEDPPTYRSLPEMARNYLAQIATVQPVGPYRLVGWSGGGLIAYEIANQLLARGETVELLG
ncbi:MAG TPA: amino acid adenylation domain-containing protein, partial [Kofleriaceae bacterium]